MNIPVENVGSVGIIKDVPADKLPLQAWTDGRNVRFRDGKVVKFSGHSEVYATPNVAPYFVMPVANATTYFWIYAGLAAIGATDGASHADVSRTVGGAYNATADLGWTGTVIEGVAVLNNPGDVPQMWTPALVNDFAALTGWDATWRARAMRSLKRYLVALDVTKGGTRFANMIKWSHSAPDGGVPTSWDAADNTLDAAEWVLASEGGVLLDGISLRDDLVLYKESQTWLMQYVGGIDIFRFTKKFDSFGMLTRKCAVEFFSGKHVVFTGEDLILHDGQQAQSLLSARLRTTLQNAVDSTAYARSFVVANYAEKEVWACYPEVGQTLPSKALVWNWETNLIGLRDLPSAAHIAAGVVNPIDATETWAGAVGTWDTDPAAWGDRSFDPSKRKLLMAVPGVTKLFLPDSTQQFNAVNMASYIERVGLGFPLKKDAPPDYSTVKLVRGLWPRISGTVGGIVNVYIGTQDKVDGPVTYANPQSFTIGSSDMIDCLGELDASRLHALKFESTDDIQWALHGYEVDVVPAGMYVG